MYKLAIQFKSQNDGLISSIIFQSGQNVSLSTLSLSIIGRKGSA